MSAVGYSGTPLHRKLGIKPRDRVLILGAHPHLDDLVDWPEGTVCDQAAQGEYEIILTFVSRLEEVPDNFDALPRHLVERGGLWFCWPKKTSSLSFPGLTEDAIRAVGLRQGLVDNKVCAIDHDWSALRFVRRKQ